MLPVQVFVHLSFQLDRTLAATGLCLFIWGVEKKGLHIEDPNTMNKKISTR